MRHRLQKKDSKNDSQNRNNDSSLEDNRPETRIQRQLIQVAATSETVQRMRGWGPPVDILAGKTGYRGAVTHQPSTGAATATATAVPTVSQPPPNLAVKGDMTSHYGDFRPSEAPGLPKSEGELLGYVQSKWNTATGGDTKKIFTLGSAKTKQDGGDYIERNWYITVEGNLITHYGPLTNPPS